MNRRTFATLCVAVPAAAGIGYGGWRVYHQKTEHTCKACSREVHEHSRTVAIIDGKRGVYCCPSCALAEHKQSGKPVEIVEIADYNGGPALVPSKAILVRDSDVNMCKRHMEAAVDADKRPMQVHFDRCSPSILAFRDVETARSFAAKHGGQVLPFAEMAPQFAR